MSILEKAKAVTQDAAERAADIKEQAKGHAAIVASTVAEKATTLGDQTTAMASDLRARAGTLTTDLTNAAVKQAQTAAAELNAALPLLKRAGYTINEVSVEVGIPPKIVAGFTLSEKVPDEEVETMLAEHTDQKLASMLIRTLIMANRLQSSVNIGGLHPKGIALEIGFSPTVIVRFAR